MDSQKKHQPTFSFEFFPPKTSAGMDKLRTTWTQLADLRPRFFSCTYGAGGSTRDRTVETVLAMQSDGLCAAPHLCCVGSTRADILTTLELYRRNGIRHLVALRGDIPADTTEQGEFRHASDLVACIREETGDDFHIAVACYPECHPEAENAEADLRNFKRKIDAGADAAITQYFYNVDAYFRFIDDCEKAGIDVPIVPGIMPITDFSQLVRFSTTCGAEIPRWLRVKLQSYAHDIDSVRRLGLDVVTQLCDRLLSAGAPGLHFYTLNQATLTLTIWQQLGLCDFSDPIPRPIAIGSLSVEADFAGANTCDEDVTEFADPDRSIRTPRIRARFFSLLEGVRRRAARSCTGSQRAPLAALFRFPFPISRRRMSLRHLLVAAPLAIVRFAGTGEASRRVHVSAPKTRTSHRAAW